MRARNVKPGFFKNEILAECHPLARILFEGLWCLADREGRLEDRPMRIKAEVLPYDAKPDIGTLLDELASKCDPDGKPAFIIRYSVGTAKYIKILHFLQHQNPHVREPESTIPAPDEHSASTVQAPDEHRTGPALSPSLNPESPILNPHIQCSAGFDEFWTAYPRKVGKGAARKAWIKIRSPSKLLSVMLEAIEKQKSCDQWKRDGGQYIPNPATWLNGQRWEDEVSNGKQEPPPRPDPYVCKLCGKRKSAMGRDGICMDCSDTQIARLGNLITKGIQ